MPYQLKQQITDEEYKALEGFIAGPPIRTLFEPVPKCECGTPQGCGLTRYEHPMKMKRRWKPEKEDGKCLYYYLHLDYYNDFSVMSSGWSGTPADEFVWSIGNCFPTKEAAESAAQKIKELLLNLPNDGR